MISKLITVTQTRQEAIKTLCRALNEYVIEGIKSTIPFHLQLMQDERFRSGDFNTRFLPVRCSFPGCRFFYRGISEIEEGVILK